jgi:hypothetical protein
VANPQDLVERLESNPKLPEGAGERFAGYGVMGLPFASGHVLGLRRFPASSLGAGYTSVWYRDPEGQWTFYQNVPAEQSCPRYFGSAIAQAVAADIELVWTGMNTFSVEIEGGDGLNWQVSLSATPATRLMNALGSVMPAALWRQAAVLKLMGRVARTMLRAGNLGLTGEAPNRQKFIANPRLMWLIQSSSATVRGNDLGPVGPVPVQARLGDFWIPQRGIFVIGGAFFEPFDAARHLSATSQAAG